MQSVHEQTTEIIMGMIIEGDEMAGNKSLPSAVRKTAERIMDLIGRQGYKHDPNCGEVLRKPQAIAEQDAQLCPATDSTLLDKMATVLREFLDARAEYRSVQHVTCLRVGMAETALLDLLARYDEGGR